MAIGEPHLETLLEDPEPILQRCDELLAQVVRELPEVQRNVLLLRAIGGFKYGEMAEILHIPVGTVMSSLARARERLSFRLAEYAGKEGYPKAAR